MQRYRWPVLSFLVLLPLLCSPSMAGALRVKANAPGPAHDGATWATAYLTVTDALAAASSGDEVWVAAGTYKERITLPIGVGLYGGFSGTETSRTQAAPGTNKTTLDGEDGGRVVAALSSGQPAPELNGFTVTGGRTDAAIYGVALTVRRCVVENNNGPAIGLRFNSLVEDSVIRDNAGVGVTAAIIRRCIITGNAGGVATPSGINPAAIVENNRITGNTRRYQASPGETRAPDVGGVHVVGESVVRNNLIAANMGGVGALQVDAACQAYNNTIVGNTGGVGAVMFGRLGALLFANNIVAFNGAGVASSPVRTPGAWFRNNCVFGNNGMDYAVNMADSTGQNGNLSADPRFANTAMGSFHIQPSSPCVDVGDSSLSTAGETDLDGQPRIQGARVDIGADESDGTVWDVTRPIFHVRPDGADTADGRTWAAARKTVGAAIAAARAAGGGEIWVAGGTYSESLQAGSYVALFGGFKGDESARSQRNGTAVTILQGDGTRAVLSLTGGLSGPVDGFTIRGGSVGVDAIGSDAPLRNLTVTENGVGIYADGGVLTVEDSVISDSTGPGVSGIGVAAVLRRNTLERNGGTAGAYARGAIELAGGRRLDVTDNAIRYNTACGIAATYAGSGHIARNVITDNATRTPGGGVMLQNGPPSTADPAYLITIRDNRIERNRVGYSGGGIVSDRDDLEILNNTISDNTADSLGRGIAVGSVAPLAHTWIIGNVVANNRGSSESDGIAVGGGARIYNNTVTGHVSALYLTSNGAQVVNNVLAGNGKTLRGAASAFRNNCEWNVQNLLPNQFPAGATGNIVANPRLAHPAEGNYHLQPDSPCVDAGDDSVVAAGALDLDGQPRIQGARVDIGADESDGTRWPTAPAVLHLRPNGNDAADGLTWATAKQTVSAALLLAVDGDEVWMAAGEYAVRDFVTLVEGVSLYGGFAGTESRREDRDPARRVSILKPLPGGARLIIAPPNITARTVFDGFTVSGVAGRITGGQFYAALYCDQSSPVITNNVFTGNTLALASVGGAPRIAGNTFVNNTAPTAASGPTIGGAVYLSGSAAVVEGNGFYNNIVPVATTAGAGAVVRDNWFSGNIGTAVYCLSDAQVIGNGIHDTRGGSFASGAITATDASPLIVGNDISGNGVTGITLTRGAAVVTGNTISDNTGVQDGGIASDGAAVTILSNIISNNTGARSGGVYAIVRPPATASIQNNVLHGNMARGSDAVAIYGTAYTLSKLFITGNLVTGSTGSGPAVRADTQPNGTLQVRSNRILDNPRVATALATTGPVDVRDNLIARNTGGPGRTLHAVTAASGAFINNTVVDNGIGGPTGNAVYLNGAVVMVNNVVAFNNGSVFLGSGSSPRNNIVYGNAPANFAPGPMPDPTGTNGNISVDPLFVDRAGGNYRLADGSPAINAGDDSVVLPGELDADMSARLLGPHVDIGAFESAQVNPGLLADTLRALRVAGGLETAVPSSLSDLDTDTSGRIDVQDATRLMRRAIGLETP